MGSGVAWAENLTFNGATLTWDTQTESFTDENNSSSAFASGDNVSFTGKSNVTLGEDIAAGTVAVEKDADVTIDLGAFKLNADRVELSGSLDMGDSLNIGAGSTLSMEDPGAVLNSNLVIGENGVLSVTGAGGGLNGHALNLHAGASLILTGAVMSRETTDVGQDGELSLIVNPTGDGKTYTLLTGVGTLIDKSGNALTAGSYEINDLFDASQPGSGFWEGGTLVYSEDGTLTLVRHNETVKDAIEITSRRTGGAYYQYYKGATFSNLKISSSSSAFGGAIEGDYDSKIALSHNGSVEFSGNTVFSYSSAGGGAIYGGSSSTITLSHNGSVVFEGNSASSKNYSADGGAIFGGTVTLSHNGSVVFEGNSASSKNSSAGGAIFVFGDITLSNNGSVSFIGNTASASSSSYPDIDGGGAIYGDSSTITLSHNGSVTFSGNRASSSVYIAYGGAIDGHYDSTITLSNNGSVVFEGNSASSKNYSADGGAIFGGTVTLSHNGSVVFEGNSASSKNSSAGGAIDGEDITLNNNGSVSFIGNTVSSSYSAYGGAIDGSTVTLSHNGSVVFEGNSVSSTGDSTFAARGGAIYGGYSSTTSTITLTHNGSVSFIGNTASTAGSISSADGGAIYGDDITLSHNGSVTFSGNRASSSVYIALGGAIHGDDITLSRNASVVFEGNSASSTGDSTTSAEGGAIQGSYDITLSRNGSVSFIGNSVSSSSSALGGAIQGGFSNTTSTITLSNNASVVFEGNSASSTSYSAYGGAIQGEDITLSNNGSVSFIGNSVSSSSSSAYGGAIQGGFSNTTSTITLSNNGSVVFEGNTATSSKYYSCGGAIYGGSSSTITLSENESMSFIGNSVSSSSSLAYGGAIYGGSSSTIELSNNGSVEFIGNTASSTYSYSNACGGAIYGDSSSTIELSNNGSVVFEGNTASSTYSYSNACGGAIYTKGSLSIRNNDSVLFEKNVEKSGSSYRLRSVYMYGGSGDMLSLFASAGKSIEFRDSLYVGAGTTVNLNERYGYAEQAGDIIFTGATTVDDLRNMKGSAGSSQEILNSRTTEVYALTNLYGGRLRVEEGAIYKGYGITAHEGSAATVRVQNATLNHMGYDLTFNAGTTLAAEGVSSISGNVVMLEGSNLALTVGAANSSSAVLTLDSAMDLQGVHLAVTGAEYLLAGKYQLIHDSAYHASEWSSDALSITGCAAENLAWENGVLTLTCSNTWNQAAADGATIGDILGNLVVNAGAEVSINGSLRADAQQQGKGHLIIDTGVVHLEQDARIAGDVVFVGAQQAERVMIAESETSLNRVVLATSQSANSKIEVSSNRELVIESVTGTGNLIKVGDGTLKHTGTSTEVQGKLMVNEGRLVNTGTLAFPKIVLNGGQLDNQGTITSVEINGGILSGSGMFGGLTMKAGRLVVGNSPGFQQYTDDLHAEGGELVFSVGGVAEAATSSCKGWESTVYSNIDMGGNELYLGTDTTLTVALGGSLLENLTGDFNMVLFSNVGNIDFFTDGVLATLLENTRFSVTDEEAGVREGWEAGADLSSLVQNVAYSVSGTSFVLSGQFAAVPEPATTTLSLLALAGGCARRRRK